MLSESYPLVRRIIRFAALPYCYVKLVNWKECRLSKIQVVNDLFYIFFKLKCFPDNYSPCRLWEKDRKLWSYYYGSSYDSYQREKLRKDVQRYEYLFLFDNKEVCELLCRGMGVHLPKYFGVISPDIEYRKVIERAISSINNSDNKKIIIKPVTGAGGHGIVLAFQEAGILKILTGKKVVGLADFELEERSILQEVVCQDKEISKFSSSSVNTIRVVTLYTKSNEVLLISASMRFGVGESFIDNWSAGGVAVGVNKKNGCLRKTAFDKNGKQYTEHPVSKKKFEDFQIPRWQEIMQMAKDIQHACPFLKLLGLDIAVTNDGRPILIEVNPSLDIVFQEQTAGPLLADKITHQEFEEYGLLVNEFQKNLY